MKEISYIFDDYEGTDNMMRFRFKAWRQVKGWSRDQVKEFFGKGADINKFERPDGPSKMITIWRMIHELGVDAEFLTKGSYRGIKDKDMSDRLKVLMSIGHTVTDKQAAQLLSDAGLDRRIELK
ncbi:hypothetical protein [Thalassobius sp. Cn5-15]|uniref:hypothetical protein n=1 Tax=Thalassobius sp. Cn5-15 TaxID=2917763 RepID=UPI001EF365CF|nr:hypothetical protein [Thalassobius sp. Cn5-15]MCG7492455.1 hypothetical protein [Thalassobius sp. Cn5-15]